MTKVGVASSLAGAVMMTFFAPPLKWRDAFSVLLYAPVDHGGVRLAEHADPVAVDDEVLILTLHRAGELTEHGIVLDHIDHVIHVRLAEIDAADVKRLRTLHHDAQDDTSDSAEAVDADFDRHS